MNISYDMTQYESILNLRFKMNESINCRVEHHYKGNYKFYRIIY